MAPCGRLVASINGGGARPGGNNVGMQAAMRQVLDCVNAFFPASRKKLGLRLRALFLGPADVGFDVDVLMFHDVGSFA